MKKQVLTVFMAGILTASMSMTALAGWEQEGNNWKYNDNGTYATNGWKWIDGDNNGIAESYYFDNNGYMLVNTTTPDGYTVNADGAWIVEGEIQTQGAAANHGGAATGEVNHNAGYDPAHPLAGKIDEWNLRLPVDYLNGKMDICSESLQARLTNQMEYYNYLDISNYATLQDGMYIAERNGTTYYVSKEDYEESIMLENTLYEWFCNWLNGMDFENMTEMERAKEIQKVMAKIKYGTDTTGKTRYTYYRTLIMQEGNCAETAMTARALAKALGLKSAILGAGAHVVYYIQVDGVAYFGEDDRLNLDFPTPDHVFFVD
ncbi:hypothetical protein [Otoolea muris]|uniref:hypothetical protein n=1 Tax=Otoolea muris TaxID=2941515 RepID=UPI00204247CA|nr:hypothetical protein [Otoolea muris]